MLDGAHLQVVQVGDEPPLASAHDQALLEEEHLEIFSKTRPSVMEVSPKTFGLSKFILPIDH